MAQDYYIILGVAKDASAQDIKRAFRQIARECHPDVAGSDPGAEERFKTARKAYETLMDPVTRARYDRRGQRRSHPRGSFFDAFYRNVSAGSAAKRGAGAHDAGGHASSRGAGRDPGNDLDLDDLFNDFGDFGFGRSSKKDRPRRSPAGGEAPPPEAARGADVHIELDVPAGIAQDGGSVTAVYQRMQRSDTWRPGAEGLGIVRVQDVADIRVAPGTSTGDVLRERGLGDAGPRGGAFGDLVVRVFVRRGERHTRSRARPREEPTPEARPDDLEVPLEISVVEALLGGRVGVETPQGPIRLTIPAGTSSGVRLRLKGKGPRGPRGPRDLYVRIRIVVPTDLDEASRALVERFAELNPENPRE